MNGVSSVNMISFRGSGSETAGSIAYRNNSVSSKGSGAETAGSVAHQENLLSFRGSGSESAGSIAYRNNSVPSKGYGAETAGSVAYGNNSLEKLQSPNFKGQGVYYLENETKKSPSMMGILLGGLTIGALAVGGLGYAHKTGFFQKAEWLKKLEPAGKKCHEWCTTVKTKSIELWDKVKNFFSKKD